MEIAVLIFTAICAVPTIAAACRWCSRRIRRRLGWGGIAIDTGNYYRGRKQPTYPPRHIEPVTRAKSADESAHKRHNPISYIHNLFHNLFHH